MAYTDPNSKLNNMAGENRSLRSVHEEAEEQRRTIEQSLNSNSEVFQENLLAAIKLYEQCLSIAEDIALFSPNETLEDINTADLQYLLLDYRVADLILRVNGQHRGDNLHRARGNYERFLKRLDGYDILSGNDASLLEQYRESPSTFSPAASANGAVRRDIKISRFKEEKALKQKLDHLRSNPSAYQHDDSAARDLHLTNINYCVHQTFQSLESIAQELQILSLAPTSDEVHDITERVVDVRERNRHNIEGYSDRLDPPLVAGLRGPLLDSKGKPLRPFTLTSKRQEVRSGVFRPDHNLPTMSIDEYLEEERRRGGIIDGGGPQSQTRPEVDEDDIEAADLATLKAREWDEFVEANPKGSGNTLNRG